MSDIHWSLRAISCHNHRCLFSYTGVGNVINNPEAFKKALQLHQQIELLKDYEKVCIKFENPLTGAKECLVVSTLQVFNFNETEIRNVSTNLDKWLNNPLLLFYNGRPASLNFPNLLGKYSAEASASNAVNQTVKYANAIRVTYYTKYVNTWESDYDTVIDWEERMIDICKATKEVYTEQGFTLNFFAARTTDDAILESTVGDLPLFSVAFILMVAFCLLVFSRWKNMVTGHLTVAIMGICVIMLGVGCGFGFSMWIRTDFVAFTGILMFLILGIGKYLFQTKP